MRRISTLLVAAALAAVPSVANAEPRHDAQTESFEMMSVGKGRLGVLLLGITPELRKHYGVPDDRGVLVARVEAGSPAASAGVQAGDIITEASGRTIAGAGDLLAAVDAVAKGQSLDLEIERDHKPLSLRAKLTTDPVGMIDFDWFHEMFRRFANELPRPPSTST